MKAAAAIPGDGAAATHAAAGETSLESFVAQLRRDGVTAGQREAERLLHQAREESAELLRSARAEADALLAQARERAAAELQRGEAELQLAARDTLLQLYSAINRVLEQLLGGAVDGVLRDPAFLPKLVSDVVLSYARADAAARPVAVQLPQAAAERLEAWSAQLLAAGLAHDAEVAATLRESGFAYRLAGGGTVEVNTAGIVAQLLEYLRPRLREIVASAVPAVAHEPGHERAAGLPHPGC